MKQITLRQGSEKRHDPAVHNSDDILSDFMVIPMVQNDENLQEYSQGAKIIFFKDIKLEKQ